MDSLYDNVLKNLPKKPNGLIISDLKWKYLIRSILRGKNIMFVGHSGSAKTYSIQCAANALGYNLFIINCGSSQDARSTLIGNTTFKKEIGTLFHASQFISAVTSPNTIVLLDEFSRGTHDLMNILMPALDPIQRTLRLDEDENGTVISINKTVTFIATCNIGHEYTATKILDRAILRRFPVKIEMTPLTSDELSHLISVKYSDASPTHQKSIRSLVNIYSDILEQYNMENSSISNFVSVANIVEMVELIFDGFSIVDIAQVAIFPEFSDDGGNESERTFIQSLVQKHIDNDMGSPINDPVLRNKKGYKSP